MSSNLYKASWVVVNDDARVVDTNELVKLKIKKSDVDRYSYAEHESEDEDGFSSGLNAGVVDALLDPDREGAVIKSTSLEQQATLNQELENARAELESVKAETAQMMDTARAQIEDMRIKVQREAEEAGFSDGYEKGMAEVQTMKNEYLNRQRQLEEEYAQKIEELEPAFVETLSGIYEHIFKVDLAGYSQIVINLLTDALLKTDSASNYIVHVSKEDYPMVNENRGKILEETGVVSDKMEIVSDVTLKKSQCMIETEGGIYDCSLGTELEELSRRLKLLSYSK